jgi:hypothetical protein
MLIANTLLKNKLMGEPEILKLFLDDERDS